MSRKARYTKPDQENGQQRHLFIKPLEAKNSLQQFYIDMIREMTVTMCTGPAGTGKTYLATYIALEALLNKDVDKIILTRPIVACEDIGYLPGDMMEKIHPYLMPLFDAVESHVGPTRAKEMLNVGSIEVIPLAFMRGRSLNKCVTADSLVLLSSGDQIRIDTLLEKYLNGDDIVIKSFNIETQQLQDSKISFAFKQSPTSKLLKITLEDGTVLKVTKDHELYLKDSTKIKAQNLKLNDELLKITF